MSTEKKYQITYLLLQYLDRIATEKEEAQLFQLLEQEPDTTEWEPLIEEMIASEPEQMGYSRREWQPIIDKILETQRSRVFPIARKKPWLRIAVAASILVVIGLGIAKLAGILNSTVPDPPPVVKTDISAPEKNKALITLADGRIISLDSLASGMLAEQGAVKIMKNADGVIVYDNANAGGVEPMEIYNALFNPRGSRVVNLTLSDGTKVWLNSESSIKYPIAFTGTERNVEITGEAFFEVAKDARRKFTVTGNSVSTEVLGTQFNINTYDNEPDSKVTLIEGSIRVIPAFGKSNAKVLRPGEQAQVNFSVQLQVLRDPDLEKTLAWKNNEFIFEDDDLRTILQQLARWYDINFDFKDNALNTRYTGRITRTVPISQVLAMFEKLGYVKFEIKGKHVAVVGTK